MTKPTILQKNVVAKSRLFTIESLELKFSNNEQRQHERIRSHSQGAVMIIPLLDAETILLIREYATGVEDYVLAFPKGSMEKGEELYCTANRELMEEVGYSASKLDYLAELSTSPSYMTSKMHIILARDLRPQKFSGDEPEPIEVIPWSLHNVDELLLHQQFHEARSVAALLLFLRRLHE